MATSIRIPEKIKSLLKKPFGKVYTHYEELKTLSKSHRIISVGDVCTLALLGLGIKPHLAVFDFKYMRRKLDGTKTGILKRYFGHFRTMTNVTGTLSIEILKNAKKLMTTGGAILIEGEEDLTALAFIKDADKKTLVIYGQPHKGIVVVKQDSKTKNLIKKIFDVLIPKQQD